MYLSRRYFEIATFNQGPRTFNILEILLVYTVLHCKIMEERIDEIILFPLDYLYSVNLLMFTSFVESSLVRKWPRFWDHIVTYCVNGNVIEFKVIITIIKIMNFTFSCARWLTWYEDSSMWEFFAQLHLSKITGWHFSGWPFSEKHPDRR